MTGKGTIDLSTSFRGRASYPKIEKALRQNGIAVMRKGNRDKITIGRDNKTVVIYGNAIYSPARDKGVEPPEKWLKDIVSEAKRQAANFKPLRSGKE